MLYIHINALLPRLPQHATRAEQAAADGQHDGTTATTVPGAALHTNAPCVSLDLYHEHKPQWGAAVQALLGPLPAAQLRSAVLDAPGACDCLWGG